MAYTLNQGIHPNSPGIDRSKRRWLLGLPILALALITGLIISHHSSKTGGANAQLIPVTSTLKVSGSNSGKGGNDKSGSQKNSATTNSDLSATASAQPVGSSSSLGFSSVSPISSGTAGSGATGGTGGVVGGFGGGPTGGGTGGSTGGSTGGGVTIPDCSIGQIATVTCLVTSCSPPVTLAAGQKAILGVNGTCVIIN